MFAVGLSLVGTINASIKLFLRTGRGMLYCISWDFEILLVIKVDAKCYLGRHNEYLSMSIAIIAVF